MRSPSCSSLPKMKDPQPPLGAPTPSCHHAQSQGHTEICECNPNVRTSLDSSRGISTCFLKDVYQRANIGRESIKIMEALNSSNQ